MPTSIRTFILACFFLSGMSGLVYQILWTRMLVEIIGGTPFSVSIILTVFMGGLGFGSYLAGRRIDRVKTPSTLIKLYGTLELVIGLYAGLIPVLLLVFKPLQSLIYNNLYAHFLTYNLFTFLLCAVILCVPVVCMGATLPILFRFYVDRMPKVGAHAGRLYGLNTIGAAAGSLVSGFWLIQWWGVPGTMAFAVATNSVIGLACLLVGFKVRIPAGGQTAKRAKPLNPGIGAESPTDSTDRIAALVIFAVSGFCAMACEVVWTSLLGLMVGPTTYSFTVVLVTFITGLALGSILFGWFADRVRNCLALLLATQVAAALLVLGVSQLLGDSQLFFAKLIFTFKDQFGLQNVAKAGALFLLMILPTLCFGASFPLVSRIYTRSMAHVGRSIGFAYMVNTVGALLGPFIAGFVLIPWLGKEASLKVVAGLQLATSVVIAGLLFKRNARDPRQLGVMAATAVVGLLLCWHYPSWSHRQLSIGKYHDFDDIRPVLTRSGWLEALFHGTREMEKAEKGELVYYGDGIGGFTSVVKFSDALGNTNLALANSGKTDASSRQDMETQTLLAHVPMLYHRNPRSVMVIGLASGITAGEVLHYPVAAMDVLEINQQVVEASRFFDPWNSQVLADPRTRLILQDARAHLQLTRETYDVIISEPSNPWMEGLAALFTRDFFALARERLREGGLFAQWIHAYQMDWRAFAMVGRSFAEVFPDSLMIVMSQARPEGDYILVGFKGKDHAGLQGAQARRVPSRNVVLTHPQVLTRLVVSENLPALFGPGEVHTDRHPQLEFIAPRLMYHRTGRIHDRIQSKKPEGLTVETRTTIGRLEADVDAQIDFAAFALSVYSPFGNMVDMTRAGEPQKRRFAELVEGYCAENELDYAMIRDGELRQRCLSIQIERLENQMNRLPNQAASLAYLAGLYAMQGQPAKAVTRYKEAAAADPLSPAIQTRLGFALAQQGQPEESVGYFRRTLQLDPGDPKACFHLGYALARLGRSAEAQPYFRQAVALKADYAEAYHELGLALVNTGQTGEAIRQLEEAVRLTPHFLKAQNDLGVVFAMLGRFDEAIRKFSEALRIHPHDAEIHTNIGMALVRNGRIEEGIVHFKTALEIEPGFAPALDNLQKALALQGK
ncbi:MAG TPA: fused MFS/spermidine synthase [Desulfobacterales bacterium]|nr:fused MFS/spermidine synthase [Desulfobacterales bacterium]